MSYKHNKTWRLKHTTKRNIGRKRYYNRFPSPYDGGRHWTVLEIDLALSFEGTDRQLHIVLGRSVQAIQTKRCKLNNYKSRGYACQE